MTIELYKKNARPPQYALKQITGGRINGKTDISPQWRIQALTEMFGLCGLGWKICIKDRFTENHDNGEVSAHVFIDLFIKVDGVWSDGISGIGGSMLTANEKNGLYNSDEAYKMAETDAISVACKKIGIGSDIYLGLFDGSKYKDVQSSEKDSDDERLKAFTYAVRKRGIEKGVALLKTMGLHSLSQVTDRKKFIEDMECQK